MRLTVLVDNNTLIDRYFLGEPGLSLLIEENHRKYLFDTGYSDIFLSNALKMNQSLLDLDFVIISHGHSDHTGGLEPLAKHLTGAANERIPYKRPTLIAHPLAFQPKKDETCAIGSFMDAESLNLYFDLKFSKEPLWLTDNLVFLGEIPRKNDFEAKKTMGKRYNNGLEEADDLIDDTAMAYRSRDGLVIITGCSHAGICNIVEYGCQVCKENRVLDIIGGFHLLKTPPEQLQGTQEYLKKLNPASVHACHCTDQAAKIALAKVTNLQAVGVGMHLDYPGNE